MFRFVGVVGLLDVLGFLLVGPGADRLCLDWCLCGSWCGRVGLLLAIVSVLTTARGRALAFGHDSARARAGDEEREQKGGRSVSEKRGKCNGFLSVSSSVRPQDETLNDFALKT